VFEIKPWIRTVEIFCRKLQLEPASIIRIKILRNCTTIDQGFVFPRGFPRKSLLCFPYQSCSFTVGRSPGGEFGVRGSQFGVRWVLLVASNRARHQADANSKIHSYL
jgi:hypothetical protein